MTDDGLTPDAYRRAAAITLARDILGDVAVESYTELADYLLGANDPSDELRRQLTVAHESVAAYRTALRDVLAGGDRGKRVTVGATASDGIDLDASASVNRRTAGRL